MKNIIIGITLMSSLNLFASQEPKDCREKVAKIALQLAELEFETTEVEITDIVAFDNRKYNPKDLRTGNSVFIKRTNGKLGELRYSIDTLKVFRDECFIDSIKFHGGTKMP